MGRYRALLIANSIYTDQGLPDLKAPQYDLRSLSRALTDAERGLFDADEVREFANADSRTMASAMEAFFQAGESDDTMLLYFSGHGTRAKYNELYLCASDTKLNLLRSSAIHDEQVNLMMRDSNARTFVVILDCCSSGSWKSTDVLPDSMKGDGRFLLASSRPGQNSADAAVSIKASPFTKLLVEAMEEAELDTDVGGYIDIDTVYKYVESGLRGLGQTPVRDFAKTNATVALARRSTPEPRADQPPAAGGPVLTGSTLVVVPDEISVSDIPLDRMPAVERVYAHRRDGTNADWVAETDDAWITLEQTPEFARATIAPRHVGRSQGLIYVRERGSRETVRVRVVVEVPDVPAATPAPKPDTAVATPKVDPATPAPKPAAPAAEAWAQRAKQLVDVAARPSGPARQKADARPKESNRSRFERELKARGYQLGNASQNVYYKVGDTFVNAKPRIVIRDSRIRFEKHLTSGSYWADDYRLAKSLSLEDDLEEAIELIDNPRRWGQPIDAATGAPATTPERKRMEKALRDRGYSLGFSAKHVYYHDEDPYPERMRIVFAGDRLRIEERSKKSQEFELLESFHVEYDAKEALAAIDRLRKR